MRARVISYIDGYNLYYGLRDAGFRRYYWLNPCALSRAFLKPDQDLVSTKYFTSRVSRPPDKVKRQTTFLEAVQTLPDLKLIEGRYDGEDFVCKGCGRKGTWHNEKMTDVNIAVEITKDAHADRFDVALLITGDADQVPTIRMVRELFPTKRVICAFPPRRVSEWLKKVANGHVHINHHILSACMFPGTVIKSDGFVLTRPAQWV
jgi:uncharacterized LabA/DUF88 family protein